MNYYTKDSIVYLNGEWIPADQAQASLYNQTIHYGIGVFEGIRSYDTESGASIFRAEEHFERLLLSAKKMHIPFEYSVNELTDLSYTLLEKNGLTGAYIRPLVYADPNMSLTASVGSNLFICAWEWGRYFGGKLLQVMSSSYQRPNPKACHMEAKTVGHYTNSILATAEAKQKGFDDALLLDINGFVAEGAAANFFFEKDKILYTSPLGSILPGITRKAVMELADGNGFQLVEKHFTIAEVKSADSAFFTGTAAEVAGIERLDDYYFPLEWEESIGSKLSDLYQKEIRKPATRTAKSLNEISNGTE